MFRSWRIRRFAAVSLCALTAGGIPWHFINGHAPLCYADDKAAAGDIKYTNRLSKEGLPYLQQHAHNPVDWYPWGAEAFEKAKKENKPIFLSIGYSTCHWCHVMERESFENPEIAKLINDHFVAIKVDREERPDLDAAYMNFVQATTASACRRSARWS